MVEQREKRRLLCPGAAFNPLVMDHVPELPGTGLGCGRGVSRLCSCALLGQV